MENQKTQSTSEKLHQDLQNIQIVSFQNQCLFVNQNQSPNQLNRFNTIISESQQYSNFQQINKKKNKKQQQRKPKQSFQIANSAGFMKNIKKIGTLDIEGNGRVKLNPIKKSNFNKPKLLGAKKCLTPFIEQVKQNVNQLIIKIIDNKAPSVDENNSTNKGTLVAVQLNQEQIITDLQKFEVEENVQINQNNQLIEKKTQAVQKIDKKDKQNIQNPKIQQQFQPFNRRKSGKEERKLSGVPLFNIGKGKIYPVDKKKELNQSYGLKKSSKNSFPNQQKKSQSLYLPRILKKASIEPVFYNVQQRVNKYQKLDNNKQIKANQETKDSNRGQKGRQVNYVKRGSEKRNNSSVFINQKNQKLLNNPVQKLQAKTLNKTSKLKNFNHQNFQSQLAEVQKLACLITEACISKREDSLDKKQSRQDSLEENSPYIKKMTKSHRNKLDDQNSQNQNQYFKHNKTKTGKLNLQMKESFQLSNLLNVAQSPNMYPRRENKQNSKQNSFHSKSIQNSRKNYANLGQYFLNKQSTQSTLNTGPFDSYLKKQQKNNQDHTYKNFQASDLLSIIQNGSLPKLKIEKENFNFNSYNYQGYQKKSDSPKSSMYQSKYLYLSQGENFKSFTPKYNITTQSSSSSKLKKESYAGFQGVR